MLIGFSVSNYRSFKKRQDFSMAAGDSARHKDHVAVAGNRKLLKTALIFGANAGGKSNFIKAVDFSRKIILKGIEQASLDGRHFRIDSQMYYEPGFFEYRMVIHQIEYCYGLVISYCEKTILAEWLTKSDENGNEICIFNRETDEHGISHAETEIEYENPDENMRMKVYLADFGEEISDSLKKKTILSDIAGRVNEKSSFFEDIVSVYDWFAGISVIFPDSVYTLTNMITEDEAMRKFYGQMMSFLDTGIEDIQNHELNFDKMFQNIPEDDAERLKVKISNYAEGELITLRMNHKLKVVKKGTDGNVVQTKMMMNHGNQDDLFEFQDESDGTRRLFDLIPVLFESMEKSMILVDEIDRSFHSNLIRKFLQSYFQIPAGKSCQLIATAHDSNLLDLDLFRQDELWLVERRADHSSKLYSLSRFREQAGGRIDKEYLIGRYGAVPVFQGSFFLREETNEE